jgi:FkbH-like protein
MIETIAPRETFSKEIKCIIWDLDNTIWEGILLEPGAVRLKPGMKELLAELDSRGILHSIASKNNREDAMAQLKAFGIDHYFIYPEIHWNAKSTSVEGIRTKLNIGLDSLLFVDDQPFERDEVASCFPEVETIDATEYTRLSDYKRLRPRFITEDSARRRLMYLEDMQRNQEESSYQGPKEEFLASLGMQFIISVAGPDDLKRAEELTIRTNQLNATGRTYDYPELEGYMRSDGHLLLVCELTDKYGSYGKIGLALVEKSNEHWRLNMLLMSCRVLSRSVGSVLLTYIMSQAAEEGKTLLADFRQTGRNKLMYATYRFSNFIEISNDGNGNILFENDLSRIQKYPPYITIHFPS